MYNILVVDDETVIRKNICQMVEQCLHGEARIFEASDGNQALELIPSARPDIVITDIKMSRMDGLNLIENLSQLQPDTLFIIISGFSEFEYAQRAIEYKVLKYLLKPINRLELERTLIHAVDTVKSREAAARSPLGDTSSTHLLMEQALQQFINSSEADGYKAAGLLSGYGINFTNSTFIAIILDSFEKNLYDYSNQLEIKNNLRTQVDIILNKHFSDFVSFYDYQSRLVIIVNLDSTPGKNFILCVVEELNGYIRKLFYPVSPAISISSALQGLESVPSLYREAVHALSYRIVSLAKQVFFADELKSKKDDLRIPVKLFSMLKEAIETNNKKQISELLDELFTPDFLEEYSIESIKILYDNLLNYIFLNIINQNPDLRTERKLNQLFAMKFDDFHKINEIVLNIKKTAYFITDELSKKAAASQDTQIIQKAIAFIRKNYNKNISMSTVANYICVSYNHFSKLFKEEIGENFIDYLTNLRIEAAKELLKDPTKDIKEISETIGYSSPRHFSKLFSQYTGMLPSNYRKKFSISNFIDEDA